MHGAFTVETQNFASLHHWYFCANTVFLFISFLFSSPGKKERKKEGYKGEPQSSMLHPAAVEQVILRVGGLRLHHPLAKTAVDAEGE